MKSKALTILGLIFFCSQVSCQVKTVTKEINEIAYEFNSVSKTVKNKSNNLLKQQGNIKFGNPNECYPSFDIDSELYSVFKDIFSKERVEELGDKVIIAQNIINSYGEIVELEFNLRDCYDQITADELYQLEKSLKSTDLKFKSLCDDPTLYYQMIVIIKFKRLMENYDSL